ncbi:type II toxin-antitoxin system RelE/ParE family toxin [Ralstonia solanacearum]|uniref:type II toxin-antitoxin system RelE/ParE family toxin n=1 Tax=Ralstonia solanacearum TaxID=305 RepID=UPI000502C4FA|nr:type II toxin-antitoxin system RelE/ParE family toxin [Ralstonia solanacearum]KFX30112.1 addiction module antitoxin RelB [Ralstonia solanacearum]
MHTLIRSDTFDQWLEKLRDKRAKARIVARLVSASFGNFGDCKPVGEGISEMRIDVGAGYRVYYTRQGTVVYILLTGGSKATQAQDIKQAIRMARELKESGHD